MGARHVDVTVQLTFFEEESERERKRIDTDQDDRLSRAEIDAYLQELESRLANAVTLTVNGRPLSLTPLRAMDLDLMGQNRSGQGHHRLTLYYFAPTPDNLKLGTEVIVHDGLWPRVRALGSIQTEGTHGCRVEALPPSDPIFPPAREGEARGFKARVLSPPTSTHARVASPGQNSRSQSNKQ
jgi:hypothetical protein